TEGRARGQDRAVGPTEPCVPDGAARGRSLRGRLMEGLRLLGPIALVTGAYAWAHGHLVHDVWESYGKLYYHMVPPDQALRQTLFGFNHVLLSFHRDPVLLPLVPPLQLAVRFVVEHVLILPFLLMALAYWRRDRNLGLGIFWIFASMVPVVW